MTGRGIDQILESPSDPTLYEPYITDARDYVRLAEKVNGPIPRGVDGSYVWGEALDVWREFAADALVLNLETSVTRSSRPWPGKGIHYRMHPGNAGMLAIPGLRERESLCYSLANNHVMDWCREGLTETLDALARVNGRGVGWCGAGESLEQAGTAFREEVAVYGVGLGGSGIPPEWAADETTAGVYRIAEADAASCRKEAERFGGDLRGGEVAVCSIHWGENWGYRIPGGQRRLARALIDAGASVVHGHSSHHVKGFEVYRGKLILYGCGDFVSDYEGIPGKEAYRPDLSLMYFADLDENGILVSLWMVPLRKLRFSLQRARDEDARWLADMLNRESSGIGSGVQRAGGNTLIWEAGNAGK